MGPLEKLFRARTLFEQNPDFKALILTVFLNVKLKRLRIVLKDGTKIYIQYNNYEEYSYSVLFSGLEGDRCRFDNYDNLWTVPSRPHHYHPRKSKTGLFSPMIGDPEKDIPKLCQQIITGTLLSSNHRF